MNRGVPQLRRLELMYSTTSGSGVGVREFLSSPLLAQFQQRHPSCTLKPAKVTRPFPSVHAAYMNESVRTLSLREAVTAESVYDVLESLAAQTGRTQARLRHWPFPQTRAPSVQGRWDARFRLQSNEEQLAPLVKKQTHLVGLAPTDAALADAARAEAAAAKDAAQAAPAAAQSAASKADAASA